MALASGLGASLGIAQESTPGTIVSPTRWNEFNSESLGLEKSTIQGQGLRGGGLYPRGSRRAYTGRNAGGDVEMDVATRGMGLWFKNALGAGASTLISGSSYQQVFTPASLNGLSFTTQKLVPNSAGTLVPFTYNGCKILSWELSCEVGGILTLRVTIDAWDEVTSTGAGTPSYTSADVFHFRQGAVTLGGTASTTSGVTSISGGTSVAVVRAATVSGENPLTTGEENQRFGATKVEQRENGWRSVGGNLELDFVTAAAMYDTMAADTGVSLALTFTGTTAISGSNYPTLEVIVPQIRFDGETPKVGGPEEITTSSDFTGLEDALGNPAVQIRQVTADTSIS